MTSSVLPRLVGLGKARELIYTGRVIDAHECLRIGLANEVAPDADVVTRAIQLAEEIGKNGGQAVRSAKAAMNRLSRPGHEQAIAVESELQAVLFDSEDKMERMEAFLNRKKTKKS